MAEDKELKRLAEEKRKQEELQQRIQQGITETKTGERINVSPDGSRFGVIGRTVNDKIEYGMLIQKQFDNCCFVGQYSYEAFSRSVIILLNMIPSQERDEQFVEEVANATFPVLIPTGRYRGFGGNIREITKEGKEYDYFKIFSAIVDLLRRRGLSEVPKLWDETRSEMVWTRSMGEDKGNE